ncbi:metal-dependent hydrolase [Halostella sp. JP-L12]|uniref:metal-dependent hydrolase n=1 Tax=Halostella TaxID=1843185 RepID=UPI000EF7D9FD|nr:MULTISPECIES: metal-dependent hydrolase [Halostella]NHN46560.1 metal-dependent hydrolase [Halostella sp. JP-L12]
MDALTHVFLPLTIAYAVCDDVFERPQYLALGGFGLLADSDKLLGQPGLLHSLTVLVPISLGLLLIERKWRGEMILSGLTVAFIMSHLVLDFIDGGPVPLFYPFSRAGIGLTYPVQVSFGEGILGVAFQGPFVALTGAEPRPGFNSYGFLNSFGIASLLAFLTVYFGDTGRSDSQS